MALIRGMAVISLAGALASAAAAQDSPPRAQDRAVLEGDIRRSFAQAVRRRVGLTDEQMRRLAPLARRHEQARRDLQLSERRARETLREAVRGSSTDSAMISGQLQALVDFQKRRVQLLETEHREIAAIMTPIQRAKYFALQEQLRRRVEQMRQRRAMAADAGRPPGRRDGPPR